jgi:hypothetical protein
MLSDAVGNARGLVEERHSWGQFVASLKAVPGYAAPGWSDSKKLVAMPLSEREPAMDRVR